MVDIIRKSDTTEQAREILEDKHGFPLKWGWEMMLGMLLQECDYIEVHEYGSKCYLAKVTA